MDKIVIEGGNTCLSGSVKISGAKNAALPAIAACLLTGGWHNLHRIPHLRDIATIETIMSKMGVSFKHKNGVLSINSDELREHVAPYDLVRTMRASILLLGPLLARLGKARISLPGGCAIGARPVNLHLKALAAMGVDMFLEQGYINAKVGRLKGTTVFFDISSVTGTENIMMAATLAEGKTTIENAAQEPEVVDLADALKSMGARITGAGESVIEIEGVSRLKPLRHVIVPDRIETGTFMAVAGITGGDITIRRCNLQHLDAVINKLKDTGMKIRAVKSGVRVTGPERPGAVNVKTMPYPGFPTDMQAQIMAMMCVADGTSVISESIFENRFMHVAELRRMGADITIDGGTSATVRGIERLKGAQIMATDLRASASLIVAALAAEGETTISRIYHLDRGYERIEEKLKKLGADIRREKEE